MPKVIGLIIKEQISKKGKTYKGLYAVTEDKQEIFICFVNLK